MHGDHRTSSSFRAFFAASLARFTIVLWLEGAPLFKAVQEPG
jgi:hypothetical protein